jgi:mono/diheme cytochrome c family protein
MAGEFQKTGRRKDVVWPLPTQILRQLGVVALIVVVWAALFAGYMRLVDEGSPSEPAPLAAAPTPTEASVLETSPVPTPTEAPILETVPVATVPTPTESPALETSPAPTPEATALPTDTPAPAAEVSFSQDVLPILERRCVKCHGGGRTAAGLVLKTFDDVMKGSRGGPIVEPGNAEASSLVELVVSGEMPQREPQLLPAEIQAIRDWVDAGAPNN